MNVTHHPPKSLIFEYGGVVIVKFYYARPFCVWHPPIDRHGGRHQGLVPFIFVTPSIDSNGILVYILG